MSISPKVLIDYILLIDDHPAFSEGLSSMLSSMMQEIKIYKASSASEALNILEEYPHIDLIFLDYNLPDNNGISLLQIFNKNHISAPVILISGDDDIELIDNTISAGACAFLSKSATPQEISTCVHAVSQGKIYLQPIFQEMLYHYRESIKNTQKADDDIAKKISKKQQDILLLLAEGYSNQEISDTLSIAQSTVKSHISKLMSTLNADNRGHCVAEARRLKIILT